MATTSMARPASLSSCEGLVVGKVSCGGGARWRGRGLVGVPFLGRIETGKERGIWGVSDGGLLLRGLPYLMVMGILNTRRVSIDLALVRSGLASHAVWRTHLSEVMCGTLKLSIPQFQTIANKSSHA